MSVAEGSHPPAPPARAGGRQWTWTLSLLPAIGVGLLTLPYLYRDCVGDPDTVLMINGVLEHPAASDLWNPSHKYGVLFSWGYYWLIYHLPLHVRAHASSLIAAVNVIGWMSTVLACGALGLLASRLHGRGAGIALVIPVAFSPMVLELATYGHPFMLSMALLFAGSIVLLRAESQRGAPALALRVLSSALLFASLAVRAEALLAFPWLALLAPLASPPASPIRRAAERGLVFTIALGAFLWVQHGIVSDHSVAITSIGSFFRSFYTPGRTLRGLVVLALSAGLALVAAAPLSILRGWTRRGVARAAIAPLVLLGSALLFWLPNPAPSRHFFLALLALCELFALGAASFLGERRAIALALGLVVLNQAGAELAYRPIARVVSPDLAGSRRIATGSVPLGASLPYHLAMRSNHARLREEGRRVARVPDPEVIFFGNATDYLILALLERGGPRAWADSLEAGFIAARIENAGQTFHIVRKDGYWPRDVAAEYLAVDPFPRAKVYVQPSTRSRFDRAPIPPERLLTLP